jgi:hypothetical protein
MNELSKNLKCICLRNNIEIWLEADKLEPFISAIEKNKFVRIENQVINTADVVGIFEPATMENLTRRKNGQWKCEFGIWHEKGQRCECAYNKRVEEEAERTRKMLEDLKK